MTMMGPGHGYSTSSSSSQSTVFSAVLKFASVSAGVVGLIVSVPTVIALCFYGFAGAGWATLGSTALLSSAISAFGFGALLGLLQVVFKSRRIAEIADAIGESRILLMGRLGLPMVLFYTTIMLLTSAIGVFFGLAFGLDASVLHEGAFARILAGGSGDPPPVWLAHGGLLVLMIIMCGIAGFITAAVMGIPAASLLENAVESASKAAGAATVLMFSRILDRDPEAPDLTIDKSSVLYENGAGAPAAIVASGLFQGAKIAVVFYLVWLAASAM